MSDFANVNGNRVISGTITIPLTGIWHADLVLATPSVVANPLTLEWGNLAMTGAVVRAASFSGARSVRMVGGAGGWRNTIPAKFYQSSSGVLLSTVLQDAARECGETLILATDATIGTAFARETGPASRALGLLAGAFWYMQPNGVTYVGARATSIISTPFTVVSFSGASGKIAVGTEDYAGWVPGRTFTAPTITTPQTVSSVVHSMSQEDGKARTEVLTSP